MDALVYGGVVSRFVGYDKNLVRKVRILPGYRQVSEGIVRWGDRCYLWGCGWKPVRNYDIGNDVFYYYAVIRKIRPKGGVMARYIDGIPKALERLAEADAKNPAPAACERCKAKELLTWARAMLRAAGVKGVAMDEIDAVLGEE